jgi:hypothetical protein
VHANVPRSDLESPYKYKSPIKFTVDLHHRGIAAACGRVEEAAPVSSAWFRAGIGASVLLTIFHIYIFTLHSGCYHACDFPEIFDLLLEIHNLHVFAVQVCPGGLEQARKVLL